MCVYFFLETQGRTRIAHVCIVYDKTYVKNLKFTILIFSRMYAFEFFDRAFRNCHILWKYCPYQLPRTARKMSSQQMQAYKNYVVFVCWHCENLFRMKTTHRAQAHCGPIFFLHYTSLPARYFLNG